MKLTAFFSAAILAACGNLAHAANDHWCAFGDSAYPELIFSADKTQFLKKTSDDLGAIFNAAGKPLQTLAYDDALYFPSGKQILLATTKVDEYPDEAGNIQREPAGTAVAIYDIGSQKNRASTDALFDDFVPNFVVDAMSISQDGKHIAIAIAMEEWQLGERFGNIGIFDKQLNLKAVFSSPEARVKQLILLPDSLLVQSENEEIGEPLWVRLDLHGKKINAVQNSISNLYGAELSHDGQRVFFAGDNAVYEYDLNGKLQQSYLTPKHNPKDSPYRTVAVMGKQIAAASERRLTLWDGQKPAVDIAKGKDQYDARLSFDATGALVWGCRRYRVP